MLFKRCYRILKRTGTLKVFFSFLLFLAGASAVLVVVEPGISTWRDGIWYSYDGNGAGCCGKLLYGIFENEGEGHSFPFF